VKSKGKLKAKVYHRERWTEKWRQ